MFVSDGGCFGCWHFVVHGSVGFGYWSVWVCCGFACSLQVIFLCSKLIRPSLLYAVTPIPFSTPPSSRIPLSYLTSLLPPHLINSPTLSPSSISFSFISCTYFLQPMRHFSFNFLHHLHFFFLCTFSSHNPVLALPTSSLQISESSNQILTFSVSS